ncbi:MAG: right-handed parallel beta-helix repeat-containing protein [Clostridiales bacterium]|nr:right-handed parallel beta-helix repeat-containing protein [Clostridiales bacterium]
MFKRFTGILIILALGLALLIPASAQGEALYVAPDGDDGAAGTVSDPLATPAEALERLKRSEAADGGEVILRGGTYTLAEPLILDGAVPGGVTFKAYGDETPVFTASVPVTGFTETEVGGVRAFSVHTDLRFNALYHPERTIRTPRYPQTGSFTVKSVSREDERFPGNKGWWDASNGCVAFYADTGEVGAVFSRPDEVYCRITHAWLDEIARIGGYDAATGRVALGRTATYEVKPGDVYWFENVFEALDEPGEWYLDGVDGTLYYVPFDGETAADLTLYAPVSQYLMKIDGCSGVTFSGIRFTGSEWTLASPPEDSGTRYEYDIDAYQASTDCDAAIEIQNADSVSFLGCEFTDIGNTAVKFIKNCHGCRVENCLMRRIGSSALAIYGENVEPDAENAQEAMSGFTVKNNLIEAYGRNTYESTGVHLMYVKDSEVSHNEIHDGYYTGLSCGWIWGHEYQVTENVRITDNLIYDIGQGWLSDLGGMYLLGEQKGTVIARNVIYSVTRGHGVNDYGGNGIYTDAGSSYFTIEQNLIYDCAATGINVGGYNKDHIIRGNTVAFCKLSAFDPGRGDGLETDHTCDCYGNIFCSDNAPVLLDVSEKATYTEAGNLLWDTANGADVFGSDGYSGNYEKKTKYSFKDANRSGYMTLDLIGDPVFADPDGRDFTLLPGSPALSGSIAFEPCDFTSAGVADGESVGCGSEWEHGPVFRKSDLSAYPEACSQARFSYGALRAVRLISLWLPAALLIAAALLNAVAARRKRGVHPAKRILPVAAPLIMAALLWPLYRVFCAEWRMYAYAACLAVFMISAGAAIWLTVCRVPSRVLLIAVAVGVSFGATYLINNVLNIDVGLALGVGETVTAAVVFLCAVARAARTRGNDVLRAGLDR